MFVPIPTENICDLSSRSSRYIATTVCRTWTNFDPATWHIFPETIELRPDGTGTVSSSYTTFPDAHAGPVSACARQEFTWKLGRDGPLGMEDIDVDALYETMPKLMKSTRAWTHRTWSAAHRLVPAYLRIALAGESSLAREPPPRALDFSTDAAQPGVRLPAELIEDIVRRAAAEDVAASELLGVCKWTREMVLARRRRERFATLTRRFAAWGLVRLLASAWGWTAADRLHWFFFYLLLLVA